MAVRFAVVSISIVALSGCATLPSGRDDLCLPLINFARSVGPDEVRSIAFHTSWGSNFQHDPKPAIFAKQCVHRDYGPGKVFCGYLMEHGATEFAGRNAQRALACLAPGTRFGPDVELSQGMFDVGFGTPNRGAHISIEYTKDEELGGMVLRINADGY